MDDAATREAMQGIRDLSEKIGLLVSRRAQLISEAVQLKQILQEQTQELQRRKQEQETMLSTLQTEEKQILADSQGLTQHLTTLKDQYMSRIGGEINTMQASINSLHDVQQQLGVVGSQNSL